MTVDDGWSGLRIGVALPAPIDATAWSGTPVGLAAGLRTAGVEVVHVEATPPATLGRVLDRLSAWRLENRLASVALERAIRRVGRLDALVLVGTFAVPRAPVPFVTFEDMTVRQAMAVGDPWVTQRPDAELRAWESRQRAIYGRMVAACAMTPWAATSIVGDYGVARERVHVVGGGINHTVEPPSSRDWSRPRFLFVGRDFERKNGPAVLRAFATIHAERPDATLELVGGHGQIDQAGVVGHGMLSLDDPAARQRLADLYRSATCLVVPTAVAEAFGIVYAEAAYAGVPSIASDRGGAFVDHSCGRRVDPADEEGLVRAMRDLCDGRLAGELGLAAMRRARNLSWPLTGERVLRALAPAVGRSTAGLAPFL